MTPFGVIWEYRDAFVAGLATTGELVLVAAVGGTLVAAGLEWICQSTAQGFRHAVDRIAFAVAATPALVILFWFHYPFQALLGIVVPSFWTAVVTLMLINSLSVYRIIADAMREFPKQFVATGLVCGLTPTQILRHIQIPLLLRSALPRWIDQQVVILLRACLLASFRWKRHSGWHSESIRRSIDP